MCDIFCIFIWKYLHSLAFSISKTFKMTVYLDWDSFFLKKYHHIYNFQSNLPHNSLWTCYLYLNFWNILTQMNVIILTVSASVCVFCRSSSLLFISVTTLGVASVGTGTNFWFPMTWVWTVVLACAMGWSWSSDVLFTFQKLELRSWRISLLSFNLIKS